MSRLRRLSPAIAALGVAGALSAPALAGIVSVSSDATLRYAARAGEANDVTIVMSRDRKTWTVTDRGAHLTVGAGCKRVSAHTVSCRDPHHAAGGDAVRVRLRDGSDRISLPRGCRFRDDEECTVHVRGGPGDDVVQGNENCFVPSFVHGGAGDDRISGPGNLWGGEGSDRLDGVCFGQLDGGPGADRLDGHNGFLTAVYGNRTEPVSVTLDGVRNDGEEGERDLVVRTPSVTGGAGDDVIVGDDGHNTLTGGPGDDVLRGGRARDILYGDLPAGCSADDDEPGGADLIVAGHGRDSIFGCGGDDVLRAGPDRDDLSGSSGDDVLHARDGGRDLLHGGLGTDLARVDSGLDDLKSIEQLDD